MVPWKSRTYTPQVHCPLGRPLCPSPSSLLGGHHAFPFQEVLGGDSLFPTTPQTGAAAPMAQMRAVPARRPPGGMVGGGRFPPLPWPVGLFYVTALPRPRQRQQLGRLPPPPAASPSCLWGGAGQLENSCRAGRWGGPETAGSISTPKKEMD